MASISPIAPRCLINHQLAYNIDCSYPLPKGLCPLEFLSEEVPEGISSNSTVSLLHTGSENCSCCPVWDESSQVALSDC